MNRYVCHIFTQYHDPELQRGFAGFVGVTAMSFLIGSGAKCRKSNSRTNLGSWMIEYGKLKKISI